MGTTPVLWPKVIVYENNRRDFTEMQGNSAFDQQQTYMNMVGPPSNDNSSTLTRLKCQGVNTICERRRNDGNGNLTDWAWAAASNNGQFDDSVCQEAFDTYGDPCGGSQSRGLPTLNDKNKKVVTYVAIGVGALLLVGAIAWAAKKKK